MSQQPRFRRSPRVASLSIRSQVFNDPTIVASYIFQLPARDILRCRSVCKTWNNIISGRENVAVVHRLLDLPSTTSTDEEPVPKPYIWIKWNRKTLPYHPCPCSLLSTRIFFSAVVPLLSVNVPRFLEYEELKKHRMDPPLKCPEEEFSYGLQSSLSILGAYHNWVCLLSDTVEFIIWNQATGKYLKIDDPPGRRGAWGLVAYGLGYHDGEYKFVVGFGGRRPEIAIYAFDTQKWKILQGSQYNLALHCDGQGCFLGDTLHWLGPMDETIIVRFSLSDEAFSMWPVYSRKEAPTGNNFGLMGTMDNCLCYYTRICNPVRDKYITIWKMRIYGVKDSWMKVGTIVLEHPYEQKGLRSIFALPDDHILMVTMTEELLLYDLKNGRTVSEVKQIGEAALYTVQ